MFLLDSIINYRLTEPIWFRYVRGFFAILFTGVIIYYAVIRFNKFNEEISTISTITLQRPTMIIIDSTGINSFLNMIADLGGFYSAIAGTFYFLFGMKKHQPWGLIHMPLFCWNDDLQRNFARKYGSSAGIPLVERISKRSKGSSLEERIQILEDLLKDYYIDNFFLKEIKITKTNIKKFKEICKKHRDNAEHHV
ncbi:hypothetical protein C1645_831089 [Glomus cerebriforme]|uniref:Uncharacterized protein n=1 Tax=Glomus cerebriforme TaxID=658196 RepID=A0A397SRD5_9GLOM|nr:hypothetical protein C1645_831089 [Glomus cerebriforme]